MKITFVLGCALLSITASELGAQRLTTADPNFSSLSQLATSIGWYQPTGAKSWTIADDAADNHSAHCMDLLNKVRGSGVPDSRTLEIQWEGPDLKPGVHTLGEIRGSCEQVERMGKVKAFEKWAILAMQSGSNVRGASDFYRMCLQTYNEVVKAGIPPSTQVPARMIGNVEWSGSIQDLNQKYCAAGMTAATEKTASREAPFRADMRGDKLRIALKYGSVFLPGGSGTGDAHKMATASVWFLDLSPPRHCVTGLQVHTIRRYQFNGDHLENTSEHDYCGSAPRSAFQ